MNSLRFTYSTQHKTSAHVLSFLGQVQKQDNYAELDHIAACQAREDGSCVTCKTTLSVRTFTDRTMVISGHGK